GGRAILAHTPTSRRWTRGRVGVWLGLVLLGFLGTRAQAQGGLGIDPTGRSGTVPPLQQEELQPIPQLPPLVYPLPPLPAPSEASPGEHVFVREIRVTPSTLLSHGPAGRGHRAPCEPCTDGGRPGGTAAGPHTLLR